MDVITSEIEQYIYDYVRTHGYDEIDHWLTWHFEKNIDGTLYIHVKYFNAGGFPRELDIKY